MAPIAPHAVPAWNDVPSGRLSVLFRPVAAPLQGLVTAYNVYGLFGDRYRDGELFLPGWTTVRFNYHDGRWTGGYAGEPPRDLPAAVVFGPGTRRLDLHTPPEGISIGFSITPLGLRRLLGVRATDLAERIVDLTDLWPDAARLRATIGAAGSFAAACRLLDAELAGRLGPPDRDAAAIAALSALLIDHHSISVVDAARALGQPMSRLRRIAERHFGLPPKVLLRRSRFVKSLVAIYGRDMGTWAKRIDPSYHDQSHFIRDFRDLMGETPGQFLSRPRPMTDMSMKARQALLGAPLVTMHHEPV